MVAGQITRQARTFTRKLCPKIVMTSSQRTQDHHQHHKQKFDEPKKRHDEMGPRRRERNY